jgi:hypothetical protein
MAAKVASQTTSGILLTGLTKSFKSSQGPVHAVRGIDMLLGLLTPTPAPWSCSA